MTAKRMIPPRFQTQEQATRIAWRIAKDWLEAQIERRCGFNNTLGHPEKPATSVFEGADGTRGETRVEFD